jgi:hypothetical protein
VKLIKPLNFDYYYGAEAEQFAFYRIPRVLMTEPHFKKLSSDAKILYGLLLDRMGLSMKNGWIDNDNKVYIFFTLEDVQASLSCSHTTGVKIFAELDSGTGIERIKQGQGKPTRIYVKNFNLAVDNSPEIVDNSNAGSPDFKKVEVKTSKNLKSRPKENGSADFQNVDTNQTYVNKNDFNYIEYQSIHQKTHAPDTRQSQSEKMDMIDMMAAYREIVHENIEYDCLKERYDPARVDEYVQIMLDAICSRKDSVRVDCSDYPVEVVKSRLLKLDSSHLEYVLNCMAKNTTKVRNIKNYILTALYNSYVTIDNYYRAEVNHDLYGGNK